MFSFVFLIEELFNRGGAHLVVVHGPGAPRPSHGVHVDVFLVRLKPDNKSRSNVMNQKWRLAEIRNDKLFLSVYSNNVLHVQMHTGSKL